MDMKRVDADQGELPRTLLPGSECLYLRLYGSENNCDHVLRTIVAPFIRERSAAGTFRNWFFIRYGDPNWHLRLRFFGEPARLLGEVLPYFHGACRQAIAEKRLYRLDIGSYEREVERYGGPKCVSAAEAWFAVDSNAVIKLLDLLDSNRLLNERWQAALLGADRIFDDFGFGIDTKLELTKKLSAGFGAEFGVGGMFKESLSTKFNAEKQMLAHLLAGEGEVSELQLEVRAILKLRTDAGAACIADIQKNLDSSPAAPTFEDIACSVVHMHINRLLRSSHRAQELVIYNFLQRLYRSARARGPK